MIVPSEVDESQLKELNIFIKKKIVYFFPFGIYSNVR